MSMKTMGYKNMQGLCHNKSDKNCHWHEFCIESDSIEIVDLIESVEKRTRKKLKNCKITKVSYLLSYLLSDLFQSANYSELPIDETKKSGMFKIK